MKSKRGLLTFLLVFSLGLISLISLPNQHVIAQDTNAALQRGYRTGYSDGYMAAYRDALDGKTKDFARHPDYASASRAFSKDYGDIEDYRDGYKQGFEAGYDAGFDKKPFESEIPATLTIRGNAPVAQTPATASVEQPNTTQTTSTNEVTPTTEATAVVTTTQPAMVRTTDGTILIAKDTELILELQEPLSTNKNKPGDKFTAKVVSPLELSGAMIEGRINKITKPGRIKRRSELSLDFDRIIVSENRWGNFNGTLTEVLPVKGDNVRRVDDEGTAVGKSSLKPDATKVGAATGTGALIGGLTAGPVGVAVGSGIGAAAAVGAVIIERGKDIRLNVNQQLRIKTAYETQIR
jgi:hypothetical protein